MGDFNRDWTLVQRRGRRRPARPPFHDRGGGWMESAPTVPYRGRTNFRSPNQPVPPPRTSRYWGQQQQQSRSYADVVRGDFRTKPNRRFFSPRNAGSENVKRQPADTRFRELTRKLYALIKMMHHLRNVAPKPGKEPPKMISKMVDILATMIRPASPTDVTLEMIQGNAENWGHTTQQILQEHYEEGVFTLLVEISGLLVTDWSEQFQTAVRWAKRNLARLTQDVIEDVEALIKTRGSDRPNRPKTTVTASNQRPHQTKTTVATMTEETTPGGNQALRSAQKGSAQEGNLPPPRRELPQSIDLQPPQMEPLEQRQHRRRKGVVFTEDLFLDLAEERETTSRAKTAQVDMTEKTALEDLVDLFGSTPIWETDTSFADKNIGTMDETVQVQVHHAPSETTFADKNIGTVDETVQMQVHHSPTEAEDTAWESFDETSTPVQHRQRVTRHVNSERKMIDWGLSVRRKWLIIGDSNLARMPTYDIPDLQIDCYPGANFRHAEALMKKATCSVTVEKVVLSFGLNHRNQKARETSVKQLQGAVRAARKRFPYAEVWVPQINFSSSLARDEQRTLMTLNGHIERNMPSLSALEQREFHTEKDNVHWTKNTARAMLEHWVTLLNLTTL